MKLEMRMKENPGGLWHCTLNGALNTETFRDCENRFDAGPWAIIRVLILDLRGLTYISSSGVRLLFKVRRNLNDHGGMLLMVRPPEMVFNILRITNVFANDRFFDTPEAAEQFAAGPERPQ